MKKPSRPLKEMYFRYFDRTFIRADIWVNMTESVFTWHQTVRWWVEMWPIYCFLLFDPLTSLERSPDATPSKGNLHTIRRLWVWWKIGWRRITFVGVNFHNEHFNELNRCRFQLIINKLNSARLHLTLTDSPVKDKKQQIKKKKKS